MLYTSAILLSAAGLIASVSAHGSISSPTPRAPGAAMAAACGQQVEVNQASDHNGNIQGMLQVASSQSDYDAAKCQIWLCKGYKYEDNTDKVQSWKPGQVVPFTFNVAAPHTGSANASIVATASNSVIKQLAYWPTFASTAVGVKPNETSFSITIPDDLGSQCSAAGACVLQHWWDAASIDQTYESCVDFTVGGSGDSAPAASPSIAASSVAASTVAASSSIAAAPSSSSVSSVAAIAISSAALQTTSFPALPTTLATVTMASSTTASAAAVETSAPAEDDDSCDA